MAKTTIEWTETTWNPVTGCSKVSPGCKNCYAERMAVRLRAMGQSNYAKGFKVVTHDHALELPFSWKKTQMVFVNSMSDLFHPAVPLDFIKRVFNVMDLADQHIYQVLTKRAERLAELNDRLLWPDQIWMGVSVENADYKSRIDLLRKTSAKVKFLSVEPLLGPLGKLNLRGIDWVIVGGESGPGSRPMLESWALDARDQCIRAGVPFFFKQWGGFNKKKNGRILDGKVWTQIPDMAFSKDKDYANSR